MKKAETKNSGYFLETPEGNMYVVLPGKGEIILE